MKNIILEGQSEKISIGELLDILMDGHSVVCNDLKYSIKRHKMNYGTTINFKFCIFECAGIQYFQDISLDSFIKRFSDNTVRVECQKD